MHRPDMRSLTLIANHKLHGSRESLTAYIHALDAACATLSDQLQIMLAVPHVFLSHAMSARAAASRLHITSQDVSQHAHGAYTGEISSAMLAGIGVTHTLVGHSETRSRLALDDGAVARTALQAQASGVTPIVCIGENLGDYDAGNTHSVLSKQVESLREVIAAQHPCLIAYEPRWAIGSGKTPLMQEIAGAHSVIRRAIHNICDGEKLARDSAIPLLYGGSVTPANVHEILALPEVGGALIGSASLEVSSMIAMASAASALLERK